MKNRTLGLCPECGGEIRHSTYESICKECKISLPLHILKNEIVKKWESGYPPLIEYLILEDYISIMPLEKINRMLVNLFKKSLGLDKISDRLISSLTYNSNIRNGLKIVWRAAEIARKKELESITGECILLGTPELIHFSILNILKDFPSQKLLFFLATIIIVQKNRDFWLKEIYDSYHRRCRISGIEPPKPPKPYQKRPEEKFYWEFKEVILRPFFEKNCSTGPKIQEIIEELLRLKGVIL